MSYYRTWWGSIWQGTPPPVVSHSAVSASASPWIQRAYLSRLESGWEEAPCPPLLPLPPIPDDPPPVPADCRFPDKSFSTAARFPVRAASRSSCSFPIVDPPEKIYIFRGGTGKRRKKGRGEDRLREWNSSAIPPFFSPSLPTSSYSSVQLPLLVWRGNKSSLRRWVRPSRSTVPLALKAGGGKVSFSSTVPPPSKLPLTSPPSLVRHFLETALSFLRPQS